MPATRVSGKKERRETTGVLAKPQSDLTREAPRSTSNRKRREIKIGRKTKRKSRTSSKKIK